MTRFAENMKVYSRRNRNKSQEPKAITENVVVSASVGIENKDAADVAVTTSCVNSEKEIDKESDVIPPTSPQILAREDSLPLQQEAPPSIQAHQAKIALPNGSVSANGSVAEAIATVDKDQMRINSKSEKSKNEVRGLKRKLSNELDQIRNVAKRLEDKEVSLSGRSTATGAGRYGGNSQASMNDERGLTRAYSDVGSVAQSRSRPFQPLSVSIMEDRPGVDDVADKDIRTPMANQSDQLPSEVSNKSWKPYGSKRHGRHGYKSGVERFLTKSYKSSVDLLSKLMKHKHAWVFNKPVDVQALNLHDYHVIIKNPMDLGTVKSRLSKHLYKSPKEFAEDIKLTFNNAMTYNPKGHQVYAMAEELLKIFEAKWPAIEADYNLALRYEMAQDMDSSTPRSRSYEMGLPTPTSRLHDMGLPTPTSRLSDFRSLEIPESTLLLHDPVANWNGGSGRAPVLKKPKAKDLHKRNMTYDEKQKLSANLQSLPAERLNDIVQIIKRGNSSLSQHDDEVEVDIDSVDAETLWELDRFVLNFKKNLSKKKRRAEAALKVRSGATHTVAAFKPAPTVTMFQEHSQIGEENYANPFSGEGEREGDGSGRTSSSSSSGTGSGSSSAESDSDSSSPNGSENGGLPNP